MTVEELKGLMTRLANGPVPTQEKKLYAVLGPIEELRRIVHGGPLIEKSILDAFIDAEIPESDEKLQNFIPKRLTAWVSEIQKRRETSVLVLSEAAMLYRYQTPFTFLYNLTNDAHAIILHCPQSKAGGVQSFPPYIGFDTSEVTRFFEDSLGPNCLRL